ncbi:subunit 2 of transcription initiation factor IIA [Chloropicon primus]|uniref:Transcription initiation factor IIA subunit 2 n=1 Tax=Chloropicon primus TaxID=1764295 RepID=A0A5B8MV77_9CHLO|nr:subunit 2 of transcription initiation factor IIA [Chloropicon primus]UPR03904.1 subunit 2 of transcription initiation factor IIA [Chloropicon primus]|mmetsp:Transcript_3250/g.9043  ORF Transcript_3250/g.9043 Transcript_3250/m.9043 type:complete len:119 (-) Transcript_3250:187-543(-)|eukprot:QDZ24698.1 subunit 2 of transcription initiation factor IIA [Chloropicon primus]
MAGVQYRTSKIGEALIDALDGFVADGRLEAAQANLILEQFDKSTGKYLASSTVKAMLKGDLHTYRSFDEIYTLLVKDCEIKLHTARRDARDQTGSQVTLKADMVKLICQDAKIGQRPS